MAVQVTLNALGEGFQEARRIMTWLGNCAQVALLCVLFDGSVQSYGFKEGTSKIISC